MPVEPSPGPRRNQGPAVAASPESAVRAGAPIDVMIVHPEPEGRAAIRCLLSDGDRVRVVALTDNGADAATEAVRLRPAVVVVDDRLPGWDRMALKSRVVLLTGETDHQTIGTMLLAPASAYLVYDHFEPADLLGAVQAVADGMAWLSPIAASAAATAMRAAGRPTTPHRPAAPARDNQAWDQRLTGRERDVLELLCQGMSNSAIATALALTEKTVRNHLHRCFAKLGVRDRAEAVRRLAAVTQVP
ncbi:response regulator transcription factor [Rugosimonospora acidiphila]|uniref:response regulator transcription factor n=1 Tax=Rugosimonospora acidiphila TaxID=556531 RepID=UPI0031F19FA6